MALESETAKANQSASEANLELEKIKIKGFPRVFMSGEPESIVHTIKSMGLSKDEEYHIVEIGRNIGDAEAGSYADQLGRHLASAGIEVRSSGDEPAAPHFNAVGLVMFYPDIGGGLPPLAQALGQALLDAKIPFTPKALPSGMNVPKGAILLWVGSKP